MSRSKRAEQVVRLIETLEDRSVPAINIVLNYDYDANGFFSQARRNVVEQAATDLEVRLNDTLSAIVSSGTNQWTARFDNPATGSEQQIANLSVPADTIIIYMGGRNLGGTLAEGGNGGYSAQGNQAWFDIIQARGEPGALGSAPQRTDFAPWGGAITFNTVIDWFASTSIAGIGSNQYDLYSVAIHEMVHVLGFGTSASWDNLSTTANFAGAASSGVYGSAPPLHGDRAHWAEGTNNGGQEVALDPTIANATRKNLTALDFAGLDDIGWDVNAGGTTNTPPTIAGTLANQSVNDNATINPFSSVTISDPNAGQTMTVRVTLQNPATGSLSGGGFTNPSTGVYQFVGSPASATSAIRALVFDPADNRVPTGSTETTRFTITVNDGVSPDVANNQTTVISSPVAPSANIVDVTPDPRFTNAGLVTVIFSENVTGVDVGDFTLLRNGANVSLAGATVLQNNPRTYLIDLTSMTGLDGVYTLRINSSTSNIRDAGGSLLVGTPSDTWRRGIPAPSIVGLSGQGWWTALNTGSGLTNQLWGSRGNQNWLYTGKGDFNGDDQDDLIAMDQTGAWWVSVSTGTSYLNQFFGYWNPGWTYSSIQVADMNADGKDDIVGRGNQTGDWWVGYSTGSLFDTLKWGSWSTALTYTDVSVAFLDADARPDMVGRDINTGTWWAKLSSDPVAVNRVWGQWSPAVNWVDVRFGDLNLDGRTDVIGRVASTGAWWTGTSVGLAFSNAYRTSWSPSVTWTDVNLADFNGDGRLDLAGRAGTAWWVSLGGTSNFTATSLWTVWASSVTWVDVRVADFNRDGRADVMGRVQQSGQWWLGSSTGNAFANNLWGAWSPSGNWQNVMVVTLPLAQAQQAATIASQAKPVGDTLSSESVSQDLVETALAKWHVSSDVLSTDDFEVRVTNLEGSYLALAVGNVILVDRDAAGAGWYVDTNPKDQAESVSPSLIKGYDLLSVLSHEIGHLLGLADEPTTPSTGGNRPAEHVMSDRIGIGERRMPTRDEIDQVWTMLGQL